MPELPRSFPAMGAAAGLRLEMPVPLDTRRLNETLEGVDPGLRVAGPAVRAVALAVDCSIRLAL
ncbi:MAG: hypothetical protein WAM94_12855 [Chromatiaceae bacterium]